jgi:uncharacterized membrane protein
MQYQWTFEVLVISWGTNQFQVAEALCGLLFYNKSSAG